MDALRVYLLELSKRQTCLDDPDGFCSLDLGNQDDAYYTGCEDGEVLLAHQLLAEFFSEKG